ncbi:MAG: hypothetical protein ACP5FH_11015, partial [Terracidiphilus sp.]
MKILFLGCLLAVSAGVLSGCHGTAPATTAEPQTVFAQLVESQQLAVPENLRATGTVHARETA